jgi:hypothetical protein
MRLNDLELRSNTLIANNSPHHRHILPTRSRGSRFFARLRGAQCATLIRRPLRRHFSAMVRMSFSAKPLPHRTLPRRRPPVRSNGEPQRNLAHHVTHAPASPTPDRSSRPPKLTSTFVSALHRSLGGRHPRSSPGSMIAGAPYIPQERVKSPMREQPRTRSVTSLEYGTPGLLESEAVVVRSNGDTPGQAVQKTSDLDTFPSFQAAVAHPRFLESFLGSKLQSGLWRSLKRCMQTMGIGHCFRLDAKWSGLMMSRLTGGNDPALGCRALACALVVPARQVLRC